MNAEKFVTDSGSKWQNRKFRSNVAGLVAGPINLRMCEMETVRVKISRNRRHVTLPPTPVVDVGLVDQDQPDGDCQNRQRNCKLDPSPHRSRLDKPPPRSQSSTWPRMKTLGLWRAPIYPRFEMRRHVALARKAATVFLKVILAFVFGFTAVDLRGQNEPVLVPDAVDYKKLIPILPEGPSGWTADKPEGSTEEVGGFKITNVHRDYRKGEGADAPTASISILDSVANPDYVTATTAAWNETSDTAEGYSKSVTIDGNPGFEAYENEQKHGSLWVMVAKRYFVEIELQKQDAKELEEWIKRLDLKKLAEIK